MALKSINFGGIDNFMTYDDSVSSSGMTYPSGSQVIFSNVLINDRLYIGTYQTHIYITSDEITANQNGYDLETILGGIYGNVRLFSDAAYDITGIVVMVGDGMMLRLVNVGSFNLTMKHEDSNSSAANRFLNNGSVDQVLTPNDSIMYIYDATDSRWRQAS